jgi:DNA-binding transcriptional ArsR family regulator
MSYDDPNKTISKIAAAIGEPARVKILLSLMDGHARTSTELAAVAEVTPSTTSVHLNRLKTERLVKVLFQGKHRYYSLNGPDVANALEALSLVAGNSRTQFVPTTPARLVLARTCYDHIAGKLGVCLYDRMLELKWITHGEGNSCSITVEGTQALSNLGIDLSELRAMRRRFAYQCLDWSERRPHLAGALGAGLLRFALKKKWVEQDLDERALSITTVGRRDLHARLGVRL